MKTFFQISMLIGLVFNACAVRYHVPYYRENKNCPEVREHNRKAIWKYSLWGAFCAYESIRFAPFQIVLLIILFNVGMWQLVTFLRRHYFKRQNMVAERERIPH